MTTTIDQIHLKFRLGEGEATTEYSCQVIDATLTLPGVSTGESVQTGCPDGVVSEPGATVNGQLTGNVFADTLDTGLTMVLINAYKAGTTLAYEFTYYADLGPEKALVFSGDCKVSSFALPWTKPGYAKHPIDLTLITCDVSRPAAL